MTKPDVLQLGAYPAAEQERLEAAYAMHRYHEATDKAAFLAAVGPKIRGLATRGDLGASRDVIEACPALEIISVYGVGYDAVNMETVKARGIRLTNTPGVLTGDCADLAVAMMLALARGVVAAEGFVRAGRWGKDSFPLQRRVWGQRAGILGLGGIGGEVARRLQGFGMDIAYSARSPKDVPWEFISDPVALAARSDFLFVTLSASAETRHIVDARVLEALGPQGVLVNISRASNVDEEALLEALEAQAIAGAALDVFEGEPEMNPRFLSLPNVLLQPHHASATHATRAAMGELMRANLAAHFAGEPLPTPVV